MMSNYMENVAGKTFQSLSYLIDDKIANGEKRRI